jgi:hypothetical protein
MAELTQIFLDVQLLKNELNQDFCLIDPLSLVDIKQRIIDKLGTTFETILGTKSFQTMNGYLVLSSSQKQQLFDFILDAELIMAP